MKSIPRFVLLKTHQNNPMRINLIVTAFTILLSTVSCSNREFTCTLVGKVHDRQSDTLRLKRANEDPRFAKILIPIVNGEFKYSMKIRDIEMWDLTFQEEYNEGSFRKIQFFPDHKTVHFELYPSDQFEKNSVVGGKINRAVMDFSNEEKLLFEKTVKPLYLKRDSLIKNKLFLSEEYSQVLDRFKSTSDQADRKPLSLIMDSLRRIGKDLSPMAGDVNKELELIKMSVVTWKYEYFRSNCNIHSYSMIITDLLNTFHDVDVETIREIYPMYRKKYPDHPYTQLIYNVLLGYDQIRVGGRFIDFTLPDIQGQEFRLSELITGKVAVLDLWATWCGPCILNSRQLLPIYNEFNGKGFTVVGVAAENDNTEAMKKRIEKEKWPWINLVELDHGNHIWDIYGISMSGGRTFLLDKQGVILSINPTPEEIRNKLVELLLQSSHDLLN